MRRAFSPFRTGRDVQYIRRPLALAIALGALLAACTTHPVHLDEWGGAQNVHFAHVSKTDFEDALRRVFEASGPRIYGLRPEEGGALVEQHWALDVVFASKAGLERWRLEYAPAGDGVDVHVEEEHPRRSASALADDNEQSVSNTADYRLLWSRVEYVLGKRGDWPRCETPSNLPRSRLCSTGPSAEPPLRLAKSR
jgi:hypothetical protein